MRSMLWIDNEDALCMAHGMYVTSTESRAVIMTKIRTSIVNQSAMKVLDTRI